jgi:hypothetical protein
MNIRLNRLWRVASSIVSIIAVTACSNWQPAGAPEMPISSLATGGRPAVRLGNRPFTVGDEQTIDERIWSDAQYGFVRIEQAEPGAPPNDQPVEFAPEQIQAVFAQLLKERGDRDEPIFTETELKELSEPLAIALAKAGPGQDVTFASTGKTGSKLNFMKAPRVNTGRVFYRNDQLNIIFGIIHGAFRNELRGAGVLRAYVPGSRSHQIEKKDYVVVPGEALRYASVERPDWVRIGALPAVAPAATTLTQGAAPAPVVLSTETSAPAARTYAPTSPQPRTAPAPGTAVSSTASPSRAPSPSSGYGPGAQHYQGIEDQLRGLKKLRDQGLISEREYQAKRREIIDKL